MSLPRSPTHDPVTLASCRVRKELSVQTTATKVQGALKQEAARSAAGVAYRRQACSRPQDPAGGSPLERSSIELLFRNLMPPVLAFNSEACPPS